MDRLAELARTSWADSDFQNLIAGFPEDTRQDADALIAHVHDLTARDIKAVYLKQLQGRFRMFLCSNTPGLAFLYLSLVARPV